MSDVVKAGVLLLGLVGGLVVLYVAARIVATAFFVTKYEQEKRHGGLQ